MTEKNLSNFASINRKIGKKIYNLRKDFEIGNLEGYELYQELLNANIYEKDNYYFKYVFSINKNKLSLKDNQIAYMIRIIELLGYKLNDEFTIDNNNNIVEFCFFKKNMVNFVLSYLISIV